jgi:4a-hydroxytetrahydrobiopterin dehydratase
MAKMSEGEIQARMPEAKGWERLGDMLVQTWGFASARRALEFVNQVAGLAEQADHFPDVVLSYRNVRVEISTHDEGGLTPADFDLATAINAIPTDR